MVVCTILHLTPVLLSVESWSCKPKVLCEYPNYEQDVRSGIECTTRWHKLNGAVDNLRRDVFQRDLDILKKRAHGNLMRFNGAKCTSGGVTPILSMGWETNRSREMLSRSTWESW